MFYMAERQGFEPWEGRPSTVFKTAAFNRSATSPEIIFFDVRSDYLLYTVAGATLTSASCERPIAYRKALINASLIKGKYLLDFMSIATPIRYIIM